MSDLHVSGDILGSEDSYNAWDAQGKGRVYVHDLGPGMLASDGYRKEHSVNVDVIGIDSAACDFVAYIHAGYALSYEPVAVIGDGCLPVLAEHLRGKLKGLYYLGVARAAADVVSYGVADVVFAGIRVFVQKSLGANHHARGAETALDGSRLTESRGE